MKLSQADIDYLNDINSPARGIPVTETLKAQYIRQFDRPVLAEFERIAKKVINPNFVLCYHCSREVYDMVQRLFKLLAEEKALEKVPSETEVIHKEPVMAPQDEAPQDQSEIPPVTLGDDEAGEPITETVTVEPKKRGRKAK